MGTTAPRYDAVVFDNDGVLTHPTDPTLLYRTTEAAFEQVGVTDPASEDVVSVNEDYASLIRICAAYDVNPERFWYHHEREKTAAQRAALLNGSKPLYEDVKAIRALPVPRGVVSNNQHATVEHIVDVFDLVDLFETYTGRDPSLDGFRRKKPNPYYLERALETLGTRDVLYVGDSRVDIEAARRAGVDSAFVRRPHRAEYGLTQEPTYEIVDLWDLLPIVSDGGPVPERRRRRCGPERRGSAWLWPRATSPTARGTPFPELPY